MRRFTIAPERIEGDRVAFDAEETRHLVRVLRLGPGDLVIAADGRGRDYQVRILALGDTATGAILGVVPTRAESPLAISLVQGVPKGDKMEAIIRATTELGVARILPALAERTVIRLAAGPWRERARRWQRVAREATKQCGRAVVPPVEAPRPLGEWLTSDEPADLRICLWEGAGVPLLDLGGSDAEGERGERRLGERLRTIGAPRAHADVGLHVEVLIARHRRHGVSAPRSPKRC